MSGNGGNKIVVVPQLDNGRRYHQHNYGTQGMHAANREKS